YHSANVGNDGKVGLHGRIVRDIDPTKDGVTMNEVNYNTENMTGSVTLTDNQSGDNVIVSHGTSKDQVGLYNKTGSQNVKISHDTQGLNASGHAFETKIGDTEVTNANFNLRDRTASGTLHHEDGTQTSINTNRSSTTITHKDGDSYHSANVGNDGKVGLHGRISRAADPTKDGATVTEFTYDTSKESVGTVITDNNSGREVSISRDRNGIKINSGDGIRTNVSVTLDKDGINIQGKSGRKVNVGKVIGFIKGLTR
ncbi:MAG: hypothetical protein ACI4TE_07915, partial [Alphaproteobacteria bacterium]